MSNQNQHELNFQNSVTEALPAFSQELQNFQDTAKAAISEAGLTNSVLDEKGTDILTLTGRAVDGSQSEFVRLTIGTNPDTGSQEVGVDQYREINENSFFMRQTTESSVYKITETDGVKHLDAKVINTPWTIGSGKSDPKPEPVYRIDDAKDLDRLRDILASGEEILADDLQTRLALKAVSDRLKNPPKEVVRRQSFGKKLLRFIR